MAKARAQPPAPRPPLSIVTTKQFEKDAALACKRKKPMDLLVGIVDRLRPRERLAPSEHDQALKGIQDCRECHIQPDWLLIYTIDASAGELILIRTGTHADLFNK